MNDKDQNLSAGALLLSAQRLFGVTLSIQGNPDLLRATRRMLLVSRQNHAPQPGSPWLRELLAASREAVYRREVLVCGCERLGYDIPRWIFENEEGRGVVLIKHRSENCEPTTTLRLTVEFETHDDREIPVLRDKLVAHFANAASVISIREGGTMAGMVSHFSARGIETERGFDTRESETEPASWPACQIQALPVSEWEYLTHYTREPDGAWPDESHGNYLKWLCTAPAQDRRNDAAALHRILSQKRILGSGRFIRGRTPMVCWTALPPHTVAHLRGWRKGLRRWNFTPYGIAIHKRAFQKLNARQVRYCSEDEMDRAPMNETPYMQPAVSGAYNWTREEEWRSPGDLDLSDFEPADFLLLTHTQEEADRLVKEFGIRTFATG